MNKIKSQGWSDLALRTVNIQAHKWQSVAQGFLLCLLSWGAEEILIHDNSVGFTPAYSPDGDAF